MSFININYRLFRMEMLHNTRSGRPLNVHTFRWTINPCRVYLPLSFTYLQLYHVTRLAINLMKRYRPLWRGSAIPIHSLNAALPTPAIKTVEAMNSYKWWPHGKGIPAMALLQREPELVLWHLGWQAVLEGLGVTNKGITRLPWKEIHVIPGRPLENY